MNLRIMVHGKKCRSNKPAFCKIKKTQKKGKTIMCTDSELRLKIQMYNELQNELKKLVSQKDELAKFIINEMDNRQTVSFDGYKLITERLVENATKAGKQTLKDLFPDRVDEYINVSLSRFINSANAKKINM